MTFNHQEFILRLPSGWKQIATEDPEQFVFESELQASTVTISVLRARMPRARLHEIATGLLSMREQAEHIDSSREITFGDKWVEPKPEGDVVEVAYAGYDNRGRIFRFKGFVTEAKVLSFYCESQTDDNDLSKKVFAQVFEGFKFYVP